MTAFQRLRKLCEMLQFTRATPSSSLVINNNETKISFPPFFRNSTSVNADGSDGHGRGSARDEQQLIRSGPWRGDARTRIQLPRLQHVKCEIQEKTFIEITTIVVFQEAVVFEGRYLVAETQVNYVDY